jgi:predicted deacylase
MLAILSVLFLSAPSFAAQPILSSYELKRPAAEDLLAVSRLFEIVRREGSAYEVMVPASQAGTFRLIAPSATLLEYDTSAALKKRLSGYQGFATQVAGYRSLPEVQAWMKAKTEAYPDKAELVQYGTSQEGHALLALRVTNKNTAGPKPALMLTAATHGDELITTEVMLRLVDQLLEGYGSNPRFTDFIDKRDIYFIPVVNVDGFADVSRYETGRDPNRSYPYPEKPNQSPTPAIGALMKFFLEREIVGSIDFHAYGEMIMYPWAYTNKPVDPDSASRFHLLTGSMAATNHYAFGPISEVIYIAPGSSADYYFWQKGSTSIAIEMGRNKIPRPEQIPAYVDSQAEATWRFLEAF